MVDITSVEDNDIFLLKVTGEVDASSSIHLDQSLGDAIKEHNKVIIDCSELEYISSAGLGVFMSYINELEVNDKQLVIFGLSDKVLHVFKILGLDQLLKITPSISEAKILVNGG